MTFSAGALPASTAGFEKPNATQQQGIVPFANGLDVMVLAPSGGGKKAIFCAGILQVRRTNLSNTGVCKPRSHLAAVELV
jgi:superfamily II DNA/RNA helicase